MSTNNEPYFTWNAQPSTPYCWVSKYPPFTRPQMRYKSIAIPGRAGDLYILEGEDVYDSYVRECEITIKPGVDINAFFVWLMGPLGNGAGVVSFGCEPDKQQSAVVYDQISLQRLFEQRRGGVIKFLCDPFKSLIDQTPIWYPMLVDQASSGQIVGRGDVLAKPLIMLHGSGAVGITINGTRIVCDCPTDQTISIDCNNGVCFTDEFTDWIPTYGFPTRSPVKTGGDFPTMRPREFQNQISWDGTITRLEIAPSWRYL